jgi:hypothetical protein
MSRVVALVLAGALLAAALAPSGAQAGEWMQVSCVNPNGTSAPSDGWTSSTSGSPGYGSNNSTSCAAGSPMFAILSSDAAAPVTSSENLQYTPPDGSTLAGGSVHVSLSADGGGYNASGTAVIYTPAFKYDAGDVIFQCASGLSPCGSSTSPNDFSGVVTVPANRGGDFYIAAGCGGAAGYSCDSGASNGAWALVQLQSADFLLTNGSSPGASGFAGSLLSPDATGTADVSFTATDPGGPGIYTVTAALDGHDIYAATPNNNSGHCVAVATDSASGALMFDWQQPCPTSDFLDIPVDTTGLAVGPHQLTISVTDAAQNTSTVLDQTITVARTGGGTITTPVARRHHVRAKLKIVWRYTGAHTRLRSVKARNLPRDAHVSIRCDGPDCPRPVARATSARHVRSLWKALSREVFTAGDRVIFTFTAPGRLPERIELVIRKDAKPVAKRL